MIMKQIQIEKSEKEKKKSFFFSPLISSLSLERNNKT